MRQLITNGFFSRDGDRIKEAAGRLAQSGVNNLLLSVDAFHQETIPLGPVKQFAEAAKAAAISVKPAFRIFWSSIGRRHKPLSGGSQPAETAY